MRDEEYRGGGGESHPLTCRGSGDFREWPFIAYAPCHVLDQRGGARDLHLAYVAGAESNDRPELVTRVNVLGTSNVLEAARLGGAGRVLLASSIAVYGAEELYRPDELPLREDVPLRVARGLPVYGGGKVYLPARCASWWTPCGG